MKKFFLAFLVIILIGLGLSVYAYKMIYSPNLSLKESSTTHLYIRQGQSFDLLLDSLELKGIKNINSFQQVAKLMKFKQPKPGRYLLKDQWSNRDLVGQLRSGRQDPVSVTFNNLKKVDDLIGLLANKLEPDSIEIAAYLRTVISDTATNYTKDNLLSLFIPNTYEFYWNASPKSIYERFKKENNKFYNPQRLALLEALELSKEEVYTLASIVQKETLVNDEKPRIAGVYLNRLKRGQLLQADPTVVYAVGDFSIRRVLNKHLAFDSPYNTYMYGGLPPGPICMPDVSSIDAVLNYERHKYLYFCASLDNTGRHLFAKTLIEHNRNADRYRRYLNQQKIYK